MPPSHLIVLTGFHGSGKDTFASKLIEANAAFGKSSIRIALADPLKDFFWRLITIILLPTVSPIYRTIHRGIKYAMTSRAQKIIGGWLGLDILSMKRFDLDDTVYKETKTILGLTIRTWLQLLGTEVFRHVFGDDFWLRASRRKIKELFQGGKDMVIVTDARFPNEMDGLRRWCRDNEIIFIAIRIVRTAVTPVDMSQLHDSERFIPTLYVDREITNNGTMAELTATCQSLAAELYQEKE